MNEPTIIFADELDKLVEKMRRENPDIEYAAVVGVLFAKAHFLCDEAAGKGMHKGRN